MLAWTYGTSKVLSSYEYTSKWFRADVAATEALHAAAKVS